MTWQPYIHIISTLKSCHVPAGYGLVRCKFQKNCLNDLVQVVFERYSFRKESVPTWQIWHIVHDMYPWPPNTIKIKFHEFPCCYTFRSRFYGWRWLTALYLPLRSPYFIWVVDTISLKSVTIIMYNNCYSSIYTSPREQIGGRRSPAVACWASDHWVASSNPLRGKFRH